MANTIAVGGCIPPVETSPPPPSPPPPSPPPSSPPWTSPPWLPPHLWEIFGIEDYQGRGMIMIGEAGRDVLHSDTYGDTLDGGAGNDRLYGGTGNDCLIGGAGRDSFVFDTALDETNVDSIMDFNVRDDTIRLDNAAGLFTELRNGALRKGAFWASDTGEAHDAGDRILYNKQTGELFYDADGNGDGAAVLFAIIANKATLTHKDFFII